jgi:preprotein translocase subunit SecY
LVLPNYFNNIGISLDIFSLFSQLNLPYIDEFLKIIYWLSYFVFIIVFSLFYTQIALNSKDLADHLKKKWQ